MLSIPKVLAQPAVAYMAITETIAMTAFDEKAASLLAEVHHWLAAGDYGVVRYTGPYDTLFEVNAVLVGWAKERGVVWDAETGPAGDRFAARVEYYHTDPAQNPDPATWVSEVMIKTA